MRVRVRAVRELSPTGQPTLRPPAIVLGVWGQRDAWIDGVNLSLLASRRDIYTG